MFLKPASCILPTTLSALTSIQRFAYQNWLFSSFDLSISDFMLLYSEKLLVRPSFHAACSERLLGINEFNWLFLPSFFFANHVASSTLEWGCLQRLNLVNFWDLFWDLAGSTLSWVHKSLAEIEGNQQTHCSKNGVELSLHHSPFATTCSPPVTVSPPLFWVWG